MGLRKKTIVVDNEDIVIQEISVAGHMEMGEVETDTNSGKWKAGLIICKYGVVAWGEMSLDEIARTVSSRDIEEITPQVMELSGIGGDEEVDENEEGERVTPLEAIEKN